MALYVIPAVRALVARDLIEVYSMTQKEVAKKLGMTQPAVCQYKKHMRGNRAKALLENAKIGESISKISRSLAKNEMDSNEAGSEICELCKYIRERKLFKKIA